MEIKALLGRLWRQIVLDKKEIVSIYFYAILSGLVQLGVPVGVQTIIGFVLGASMVTSIYVLIMLVIIAVFFVGVFQVNQMKIIEKIQQRIFTRYAFEFTDKIPKFDLQQADNYYLPEKVNRFFDVMNVQKSLSKLLLDIPVASIQILFGLLLLMFYHPIFIAFGCILLFVLWLILKFTTKHGIMTSLKESNYKYEVAAWIEEIARVIKSFKFSSKTHLHLYKADEKVSGYLSFRTEHFKVLLIQYKTLIAFKVAITAAMLFVGTHLLINQQLNIGEFIAAEIVIITIINAIEKIIANLDSVYDVITGLEKLAGVTESPLEKQGNLAFDTSKGVHIKLMNFSFEYTKGEQALKNIHLDISNNRIVCISGAEGAGKTTLLKVLGANYMHFSGSILFNNIPINNYQLESLRSNIGIYLHQQDIFMGTVWENITMGRKNIAPEKIIAIAEHIGVGHLLHMLQYGFDTKVDTLGKKLPSTLVKKILLLRAFANDPALLLLEEPWQGLEEPIKDKMIDYLFHKTKEATIFVSSNDEIFARKCNYHIQLKNSLATVIKN